MPDENKNTDLQEVITSLFANNKGIYAADATEESMNERMEKVGITPNETIRRDFREIMLSTTGLSQYISGVILNDEIIRQSTSKGIGFSEFVSEQGMVPIIKVDKKCHDMANFPHEKIVEGLDGLRERLVEYKNMGAKATKWRMVVSIGNEIPSRVCIDSNAHATARYAALVQEENMVPIVEPEVLMDGDHDMERCAQVTALVLKSVFYHLNEQKVNVENVILKINMALPGKESVEKPNAKEVAEKTIEVLNRSLPDNLSWVVFLSGGQTAEDATLRVNEICKNKPKWNVGFSFERAIEGPAMKIWNAKSENITTAQSSILKRAKLNSLARQGIYTPEMEKE